MEPFQKPSTQQNPTARNKIYFEIIASALVLISSILPFLNNILSYWFDLSLQLDNNAGERRLDLDSSIYFLSISLTFIFLALAGLFKAHRFTYYIALISGYFHLVTYVKFIFFNKNEISSIAEFAIVLLLILIIIIIFKLENYYSKLLLLNKFDRSTLDRFMKIVSRKK